MTSFEIALHFGFDVSLVERYVAACRRGADNDATEAAGLWSEYEKTRDPWDLKIARLADWQAQDSALELRDAEEALVLAETRSRTVRDRRPVPQV